MYSATAILKVPIAINFNTIAADNVLGSGASHIPVPSTYKLYHFHTKLHSGRQDSSGYSSGSSYLSGSGDSGIDVKELGSK